MTVTHEAPSQITHDDPEALFPEARRRRRKIRLTVGAILIVIASTAVGLLYGIGGRGAPPKGPPPSSVRGQPNSAASPASSGGPSTPKVFSGAESLPTGAQITTVVQFHGHYVAAGAYFPGSAESPSGCSTFACNPMVWTSTNGKQWTPAWGSAPSGSIADAYLAVAPNALLLFNGDEATKAWRSTNGLNWSAIPLPSDMAGLVVRGAVWGQGRFVAILNNKFAGGLDTAYGESDTIWTSTDGLMWAQDAVAGSPLRFASLRVDATGFTVRGTANGSPTEWTSPDGIAWTINGRT
jgi:hypothetical protein